MLILALLGCPYLSPDQYDERLDADGDGLLPLHLGGRDCDDADPSIGDCDADRDGHVARALGGDDCDDADATVHPDAAETCDGLDNDCDDRIDDADDEPTGTRSFWTDGDGDGYGAGPAVLRCQPLDDQVERDGDCDDDADQVHPGAAEQCDGVDWNCDGDSLAGASRSWFTDADGDGFGDPGLPVGQTCERPAGPVAPNPFDCDDADPLAHPADATTGLTDETCDGVDNDCDGLTDGADVLNDPNAPDGFLDLDGDGFGDPLTAQVVCPADLTEGLVGNGLDCDDEDPLARPGPGPAFSSQEVCDGFDNDCDGLVDDEDGDLDTATAILGYPDLDGDGFGAGSVATAICGQAVTVNGDCDDTDPTVNPEQTERCDTTGLLGTDGIDEDCDGLFGSFDPDNDGTDIAFRDADSDGLGDPALPRSICPGPVPAGFSTADGDCNDLDPNISVPVSWFADQDGDGYGDVANAVSSCFPPTGFTRADGDCDDTMASVNPAAIETCAPGDSDCDGYTDAGALDAVNGFLDADGDGYGAGLQATPLCPPDPSTPDAYAIVALSGDCNDADARFHPEQPEICPQTSGCDPNAAPTDPSACEQDRNCDGRAGFEDPNVDIPSWFLDNDLDGFGDPDVSLQQCEQPLDYVQDGTDCDDSDGRAYFAAYFGSEAAQDAAALPGRVFDTLGSVLANPGRCQGSTDVDPVETQVLLDAAVPFFVEGALSIEENALLRVRTPLGSDPATICWAPDATLALAGALELERVELRFGRRGVDAQGASVCEPLGAAESVPTTPVRFSVVTDAPLSGAVRSLALDEVELLLPQGGLDQPLIGSDVDGRSATVRINRFTVDGGRLGGGLLDLRTSFTTLDLRQSSLLGIDAEASLLRLRNQVPPRLESLTVSGTIAGSLLETFDAANVAGTVTVRRLAALDLELDGPLFCFGTDGCASTQGSLAQRVDLTASHLRDVTTDGGTRNAALARLEGTLNSRSLTVESSAVRPTESPWLDFLGSGAATGWLSAGDRLLLPVDVDGRDRQHRLTSSHSTDVLTVAEPSATVTLTGTSFAGPDALGSFDVGTLELAGTVLSDGAEVEITGSTALTLPATHPAVYLLNTPEPADCSGTLTCETFPVDTTFVSYAPNWPAERQIPVPYGDHPVGAPDPALTYDGIRWSLDPNSDGLPVAWLQFFAADPSCWNEPDLIDPTADTDGDGRSNAAEAPVPALRTGTWPCVLDTDGDGLPDGP